MTRRLAAGAVDWGTLPHRRGTCDEHRGVPVTVYRLDRRDREPVWLCSSCWVPTWRLAGQPAQGVFR